MNRRTLLTRLALVGAAVGGGWFLRDRVVWRRPDLSFGGEDWHSWVERRTAVPVIEATVGGRTVRALVDSGAQYSVIDRALYEELGTPEAFDMPMVAYGVGGRAQLGRGTTLNVSAAGARIETLRAAILDLGPLASETAGLGAPLILGQDVLSRLMLDMDVRRRRLRFLAPGTALPAEVRAVEARHAGRALRTPVTVEGAQIEAVVDTGASSLLALTEDSANLAGLLDGRAQSRGSSIVLGGAMSARIVTARTVTVGDDLFRNVETSIYDSSPLPGFPDALVGMAAFADRRVVMEAGEGRLHVSRALDLTVG